MALNARNGTPPYAWTIVEGTPPGMALSTDGEFCGTPTEPGRFAFIVRAQDAEGTFDTSQFVFVVDTGLGPTISTTTLPTGRINEPYVDPNTEGSTGVQLSAGRGTAPFTWSLIEGAGDLPAGLTLSAQGELSGTPTESGRFAFLVQIRDAEQQTGTLPLSLRIDAVEEPPPVEPSGCICVAQENEMTTPWTSVTVLCAIVAFFALRRRKNLLGLLAALFVVSASGAAHAQFAPVVGTPYALERDTASPYVTLRACNTLTTNADSSNFDLDLPFEFNFYGTPESRIRINTNGVLSFSTSFISSSNSALTTSSPNALIAPWYDDLEIDSAANGELCHTTTGNAPRRTFTIEWKNIRRDFTTTGFFSMKVILHEGLSGRIDVEYSTVQGNLAYNATSGMEDQSGQRTIYFPATGNCGNTCNTQLSALSDTRISLLQDVGPELDALAVDPPDFMFLGSVTPIPVTLSSYHDNQIGPFDIAIEISETSDFASPTVVGTLSDVTLSEFERTTVSVDAIVPTQFGARSVFVRALIDADNVIAEATKANNVVATNGVVRLLDGGPDVAVESVDVQGQAFNSGDAVVITTRLRNVGGEAANNVPVRLALSGNSVISRQDVELDDFTVSLASGESVTSSVTVTIPAGTNSGAYFLGALVDPDNVVAELNDTNNGLASSETVTITGASLAITTPRLPRATFRVAYFALLEAVGLTDDAEWSIIAGQLPSGLGLVRARGEIFGRPIREETQTFTVQVRANGNTATAELTIDVVNPENPLTVVNRDVPSAIVGQEYSFGLTATGGMSATEQVWSATGLPNGLSISPAGVIGGTPTAAGTSMMTVSVASGGVTAARPLSIEVLDNANLLIVPNVLSTATLNQMYRTQLDAQGGTPPYSWIIDNGQLPDGLLLGPDGEISGTPQEVGNFRFIVEARDAEVGSLAARDRNAFEIEVLGGDGFGISTTSLDFGVLDAAYDEAIAAEGGRPPYEWSVETGRLPEGLIAEVDPSTGEYRIRGQPTAVGVTNMVVEVTDSQKRSAQRAFAIEVFETDPTVVVNGGGGGGDGCACVTAPQRGLASAVMIAFGLLALLAIRRRGLRP